MLAAGRAERLRRCRRRAQAAEHPRGRLPRRSRGSRPAPDPRRHQWRAIRQPVAPPRAAHPETEKFILYLDNAAYYKKALVRQRLKRHPEFRLAFLPPYSPNLNLIERLWKFLCKEALSCWHKTFEEMQAAVSWVLDHLYLHEYREELDTLMREEFQILRDEDLPVTSAVAA